MKAKDTKTNGRQDSPNTLGRSTNTVTILSGRKALSAGGGSWGDGCTCKESPVTPLKG